MKSSLNPTGLRFCQITPHTHWGNWISYNVKDSSTWPSPGFKCECLIKNKAFRDGYFHFFAARNTSNTVVNLLTGKDIPIGNIRYWRTVTREIRG